MDVNLAGVLAGETSGSGHKYCHAAIEKSSVRRIYYSAINQFMRIFYRIALGTEELRQDRTRRGPT
jgi:hypothetical protein